ncbi:hypothetical protein AB7Y64_20705, partial [Providencia rettgeri]
MLRINVCFDASKKVPAKIQQALRAEIEKEILSNYERAVVSVGKGSSAEVSISGVCSAQLNQDTFLKEFCSYSIGDRSP